MSEQQFRVNDLVKFNYSEITEYVDEEHTPNPLRNDEVCGLLNEQQATITELERKLKKYAKIGEEQLKQIIELQEENEQLRRLFEEMKQPITINLTVEDEKELRKLLGLIEDE